MSIDVQFTDPEVGSRIITIREDGDTTKNWSFKSGDPINNIGELTWTQYSMKFSGTVADGVRWDAVDTFQHQGVLGDGPIEKHVKGILIGELTLPIESTFPKVGDNYGIYTISASLVGGVMYADSPSGDGLPIGWGEPDFKVGCDERFRYQVSLQIGCGARFYRIFPQESDKNYAFGKVQDCTEIEINSLMDVQVSANSLDYQPQRCVDDAVNLLGEPKPDYKRFGLFIKVIVKTFVLKEIVLQISKK